MLHRRQFLAASAGLAAAPLGVSPARSELRTLPVELVSEIDQLGTRIVLGASQPDVTLYEFFDYNCGYCRQSAEDVSGLLKGDANLRYVLVNFAVLSAESILAHRVALAFKMQKPKRYLAFHQALFARRGIKDAEAAIETAVSLGAQEKRLVADSNSEAITEALIATVKLGDSLGFYATPSYVAGVEGNVGFLDLAQKKAAIAAFRACEKWNCG